MRIYIFILIVLLTGCSVLSPLKSTPNNRFMIDTAPTARHFKNTHRKKIIVVADPDTLPAYQTMQMAYSTVPHKIAYYSENQWAATPAEMLSALIVKTLQETHYFKAVVSPPYIAEFDYVLNTQILMLQQDYTRSHARLVFTLRADLLSSKTNRIVATEEWTMIAPMKESGPYNGVLAANAASERMLKVLRVFVVKHAK